MTKICSYFDPRSINTALRQTLEWVTAYPDFPQGTVARKRIKCPECGKRVLQRITFCHDGCCVIYVMPKHTRKSWNKRNKKGSREHRISKRIPRGLHR